MTKEKSIICLMILFFGFYNIGYSNYVKGLRSYKKRSYESAAVNLYNAMKSEKKGERRLKAEWYLARSLLKLDLFYSASKYLTIIVRRGPASSNKYFKKALKELGRINYDMSLGQSQIVKLFKSDIVPDAIPREAKGFFLLL